jgi:hypothetical protein
MGVSVADSRVGKKKTNSAPAEPRRVQKAAQERPDLRRSFESIYKSDRFTVEAAVKAFIKS